MSRKLNFIPHFQSYDDIRAEMERDLSYRLESRHKRTEFGRPLYERINLQVIVTQECPYRCPFCIERKNPMSGIFEPESQLRSLKRVLASHRNARLTITGGEPGLYPDHVKNLVQTYNQHSNAIFASINTAGYSTALNGIAHINLSSNEYVRPEIKNFPGCTLQTVLLDDQMTLDNIRKIMTRESDAASFSFRFISDTQKKNYPISIWNELQNADDVQVGTFRIGDFFVYCTFNLNGTHARITLGDMWQQRTNDYQDGYSNIIIHPDGTIKTNWR